MNSNWRNRPTELEKVPENIDYVIALDESGTANLDPVVNSLKNGKAVIDQEKHFTLGAVKIPMDTFEELRDQVMEIKYKYWDDGLFRYKKGGIKRVCFHNKEINSRKEAFSPSVIDFNGFVNDLNSMIDTSEFEFYAAHINKEQLCRQYHYPENPYDLGLVFILERIVKDIKPNETVILVLEARGEEEDKQLLNRIKSIIDNGTRYTDKSCFKPIKGVYFNPKWAKNCDLKKSYWALEIADLCVSPTNNFYRNPERRGKDFELVIKKLHSYPYYSGKGLKSFPKNDPAEAYLPPIKRIKRKKAID